MTRTRLSVLAVGLLAILLVIGAVIGASLHSMGEIRDSLNRLTNHLQRKMVEVATMRENLYLRIVSSRDMLLLADPFEIDAAAQQFNLYPARIEKAYSRYRELADDPKEIALAERFLDEAKAGLPLMLAAVDQLMAGKRAEEIVPLLHKAFQTQKQGLETLLQLQDYLQAQSVRLAQEAIARYDRTWWLVVSLTALAVALVLAIIVLMAVALEQQAAELDREHRKFKTLFESSRDAVMIVSGERIEECNRRALEWFDASGLGKPAGCRLDDLDARHYSGAKNFAARMRELLTADEGGHFEWLFRDARGDSFYGEVTVTPLSDSAPRLHQLVIRDITTRVVTLQQMSHAAMHDLLTGLPNRREFERRAELAVVSARRDGTPHVLCFLDLDRFKPVNDTAGHAAGDGLLREVAVLLKSKTRAGDLLARLGGDEFGLLLENCRPDQGAAVARSMIHAVQTKPFDAGGRTFELGISIGLVAITRDTPSLHALMVAADRACYTAKRTGTQLSFATAEVSVAAS